MKRSRCSEEQIIGILKEHQAGVSAVDLCRKYGFSDAMLYKYRSKYGGMEVSEARRLKFLEDESREMKRLLRPGSRRKTVNWVITERDYSQRRGCALAGIDPRVYRYCSKRPDDSDVRKRLRELAGEHISFSPAPAGRTKKHFDAVRIKGVVG